MKTVKQIFTEAYDHSFLPTQDIEGTSYLSKVDTRRPAKFPPEKSIPNVLTLVRKAIRVFPDNQKIALYYSQALDKYLSIPYGPDNKAMGIHLSEARSFEKDVEPELQSAYLDKVDPKRKKISREDILSLMKPKEAVRYKGGTKAKIKGILKSHQKGTRKFGEILGTLARRGTNAIGLTKEETTPTNTFKQKLNIIREETTKEVIDEGAIAQILGAGLKSFKRSGSIKKAFGSANKQRLALKKAKAKAKPKSKVGAFAAGAGASSALDALTDGGGSPSASSISDLFQRRDQGIPFQQAGRADFSTSDDPTRELRTQREYGGRKYAAIKTPVQENFDIIKTIAESNTPDVIRFDETEITINNRIAKKIVNLYESLNKDNKEKIKAMLNEDANSLKKLINFAIRQ